MLKMTARVLGVVVAVLAIAGFFVEGDHLLGFMNVDLVLDILRVFIAAALLTVGFAPVDDRAVRVVLGVVGAMYVLMALLALIDPTLFGMLPTGFTPFDVVFHLVVGAGSVVLAVLPAKTERKLDRAAAKAMPGN